MANEARAARKRERERAAYRTIIPTERVQLLQALGPYCKNYGAFPSVLIMEGADWSRAYGLVGRQKSTGDVLYSSGVKPAEAIVVRRLRHKRYPDITVTRYVTGGGRARKYDYTLRVPGRLTSAGKTLLVDSRHAYRVADCLDIVGIVPHSYRVGNFFVVPPDVD